MAGSCGCAEPKSDYERMASLAPRSIRYGREVGMIMLVFVITLAYAPASPIIVPFAWFYFLVAWVYWRYNVLYISERGYESGGRIWDAVFTNVMWCLFILEFFTGALPRPWSLLASCDICYHLLMPVPFASLPADAGQAPPLATFSGTAADESRGSR